MSVGLINSWKHFPVAIRIDWNQISARNVFKATHWLAALFVKVDDGDKVGTECLAYSFERSQEIDDVTL